MKEEPLDILLVEDNPDHAELIRRSLRGHRVANRITHMVDGEAALDFLFQRGVDSDERLRRRPHLVLLDLRLPRIGGLEVLRQIRACRQLDGTPVVILTTSDAETDMRAAYHHRANSYLVKPLEFEEFDQLMNDLGFYWLAWNRQPEGS